jgi:hypothetical protein
MFKKVIISTVLGLIFWSFVFALLISGMHLFNSMNYEELKIELPKSAHVSEKSIANVDGICTGFVIAKDLVMTAKHCMKDPTQDIVVYFENKTVEQKGNWVFASDDHDVAIVKTNTKGRTPFIISKEYPDMYTEYFLRGYPGGIPFVTTVKMFYTGTYEGYDVYTGVGIKGFSGSPILGPDGKVYGLIVMGEFVLSSSPFIPLIIQSNTFWLAYVENTSTLYKTIYEYQHSLR